MAMSTLSGKRQTRMEDSVGIVDIPLVLVNEPRPPQQVQGQHPLMNDLILKNMFQYCGHRELNNCRLVCRHWEQVAFPLWLQDDNTIKLEAAWTKNSKAGRKKFEAFIDDFHLLRQGLQRRDRDGVMTQFHKFTKFDIVLHYCAPRRSPAHDLLDSFITLCGGWMTRLELDYDCGADVSSKIFQDVLTCRHTPKLETLWLNIYHSRWWDSTRMEPDDYKYFQGENKTLKSFKLGGAIGEFNWNVFLSHYSSLEELSLAPRDLRRRHQAYLSLHELWNVLTAIRDIRLEDNTKLQLKTLSWCDLDLEKRCRLESEANLPNLAEVRQLLGELRLDLETFGVYLNENADHRATSQVCTMYGKTLKELSIYRKSPLTNSPFAGRMELEKLVVLNVGGDVFRDLLFLQDLPNLRSLHFTKPSSTNLSMLSATVANPPLVFPSITQFSCDSDWMPGDWSDADINRMRDLMPNLTSLEMRLSNGSFRKVCENFPNLVTLAVLGTVLGDEGIVGLTMAEDGQVSLRTPNITNLQSMLDNELRHFEMHEDGYPRTHVITKHSVYQGFLKLPRLETLSLRVASERMDTNTRRTLKRKIPFAKLVIWRKWSYGN